MKFRALAFMVMVVGWAAGADEATAQRGGTERALRAEVVAVVPLEELGTLPEGGVRLLRAPNPNALYSNITATTDKYLQQGPSGSGFARLLLDDVTFTTTAAGGGIGEMSFAVVNPFPAQISARLRMRLWNADGAPGGPGQPNRPGTYYVDPVTGNPIGPSTSTPFPMVPGLNVVRLWFPGGIIFNLPSPGTHTIWIGLTFSNDAGSTATTAQLASLGQMLFGPPEVGSSADAVFETDLPGSFFLVNNPAGSVYGLESPAANLGWELVFGPGPTE